MIETTKNHDSAIIQRHNTMTIDWVWQRDSSCHTAMAVDYLSTVKSSSIIAPYLEENYWSF